MALASLATPQGFSPLQTRERFVFLVAHGLRLFYLLKLILSHFVVLIFQFLLPPPAPGAKYKYQDDTENTNDDSRDQNDYQ